MYGNESENKIIEQHELNKDCLLIGRSPECDIRLDDKTVSRKHALLYFDELFWKIRDLNSRNGLFVNGKKVDHTYLIGNEKIRIGNSLIVKIDNSRVKVYQKSGVKVYYIPLINELKRRWQERQLSMYEGCLLGGAVGDALGYPVEFMSEKAINSKYGENGIQTLSQAGTPALISDDTQMTLFAANAIICSKINKSLKLPSFLKTAYIEWLATQENEDISNPKMWIFEDERLHAARAPGLTCLSAIRRFKNDPSIGLAENNSKGCGTVMRAAPFGLMMRVEDGVKNSHGDIAYGWNYKSARYDARLTHGHKLAMDSSFMLAYMIVSITQYRDLQEYEALEDAIGKCYGSNGICVILSKAIELAHNPDIDDLEAIHMLGEGWVAEEALAIALFCAVRHQDDFAAAIRAAVNHKGDSDSAGAICGNILGAWLGIDAVEKAFDLNDLELADLIRSIADDLYVSSGMHSKSAGINDKIWHKRYYKRI